MHDLTQPGVVRALQLAGEIADPFERDKRDYEAKIKCLADDREKRIAILNNITKASSDAVEIIQQQMDKELNFTESQLAVVQPLITALLQIANESKIPVVHEGIH